MLKYAVLLVEWVLDGLHAGSLPGLHRPICLDLAPIHRSQLWSAQLKTSASLTASPSPLETTLWRTTQVLQIRMV